MSRHNRVWTQSCMGTIVYGHNRVWAQSCGHNHGHRVGPIVCEHNRVIYKVKVLLGYIQTSNSKSLACDTANEHALMH